MKYQYRLAFISWRFYLLITFIAFVVVGLIARMIDLTIIDQRFLNEQGDMRVLRKLSSPVFRGIISDRNGYPLAISTAVFSVWANPKELHDFSSGTKNISKLLGMRSRDIRILIQHAANKKREFVYIKRDISPEIAQKIKQFKIPGIYLQQEYKRFYPEGEVTAHVVGFTNIDDQGQEGLELEYNGWLTGSPGKKWVIKDRLGRVIEDVRNLREKKPSNDLRLKHG